MDKGHKILGGLLAIAIIVILLMRSCGVGSGGSGDITQSDTVYIETTITDTIIEKIPVEKIVLKYIKVKIPVPYLDTTSEPTKLEEFDDFAKERPMVYQDTISDDTVLIHYRIRTWGFVDKLDIGYSLKNKYYIKERSVLETVVTVTEKKTFNGFYLGMDLGFIKDSVSHIAPTLQASFNRFNCSVGYDLKDKDVIFGVHIRIGKKKTLI